MWNKERFMRLAERALKRTDYYRETGKGSSVPEDNFQLDYVLVKGSKSTPDTAIAYASYMDEMISFNPFGGIAISVADWAFSFNSDLFRFLEQDYELVGMSLISHSFAWSEIEECHNNGSLDSSKGIQLYLDYCKRNRVTAELLRQEVQYDGMDVMTLYDKSAIRKKSAQTQER